MFSQQHRHRKGETVDNLTTKPYLILTLDFLPLITFANQLSPCLPFQFTVKALSARQSLMAQHLKQLQPRGNLWTPSNSHLPRHHLHQYPTLPHNQVYQSRDLPPYLASDTLPRCNQLPQPPSPFPTARHLHSPAACRFCRAAARPRSRHCHLRQKSAKHINPRLQLQPRLRQ